MGLVSERDGLKDGSADSAIHFFVNSNFSIQVNKPRLQNSQISILKFVYEMKLYNSKFSRAY
jgi:hypothetical protein